MKAIWKSKTFWVGALTTVIGVIGVFAGADWIKEHPQAVAVLTTLSGVIAVVLRAITTGPVSLFRSASKKAKAG